MRKVVPILFLLLLLGADIILYKGAYQAFISDISARNVTMFKATIVLVLFFMDFTICAVAMVVAWFFRFTFHIFGWKSEKRMTQSEMYRNSQPRIYGK